MDSTTFANLLTPFKIIASRAAIAPQYNAIEIAPDYIKACSSFGALEVLAATGIDRVTHVNAIAFMAIIDSLPEETPVVLRNRNGVLEWVCGNAKGRVAVIPNLELPDTVSSIPDEKKLVPTNKLMAEAFALGGMSSDNVAVGAVGVYGVQLLNYDELAVCSTDNTTLSEYVVGEGISNAPKSITLSPPGASLMAEVIDGEGHLFFDEHRMTYVSATVVCVVQRVQPLRANIVQIRDQYRSAKSVVKIPKDRVIAFVKRATALAMIRRDAEIGLAVGDGVITMSFGDDMSASDEYFMAEVRGLKASIKPVRLSAVRMARALRHVDEVVLDHIERGVIVLRGGAFRYFISGKQGD